MELDILTAIRNATVTTYRHLHAALWNYFRA